MWREALAAQENRQPLLREKSCRAAEQRMEEQESAVGSGICCRIRDGERLRKQWGCLVDINSPSLNVGWKLEEEHY